MMSSKEMRAKAIELLADRDHQELVGMVAELLLKVDELHHELSEVAHCWEVIERELAAREAPMSIAGQRSLAGLCASAAKRVRSVVACQPVRPELNELRA